MLDPLSNKTSDFAEGFTYHLQQTTATRRNPVDRAGHTLLTRILDLPPSNTDHFTDDNTNTHQDNINRLANAQLTQGCNPPHNTLYCPDRTITRAEIATILTRGLNLPQPTMANPYTDTNNGTHQQQIISITQTGIAQGCNPPVNTRFCPDRPLTRAEAATLLIRATLYILDTFDH